MSGYAHVRNGSKHEVAALQPAAREQEPRGRQPVERTAMAGWQGRHDQLMYCRRATLDPKVVLTNSANQFA
jgi:hypothetical protein